MKTSFLGIFSATLCLLATLVAASPVAASPVAIDARDVVTLDTRDTVALDARDIVLVSIDVTIAIAIDSINKCNSRYSHCGGGRCSQSDLIAWSLEINIIINTCTDSINYYRHNGGIYTDVEFDVYSTHFESLLILINVRILWMADNCNLGGGGLLGLVGDLLGLVGDLLGLDGLLYGTTDCLLDLIDCLYVDVHYVDYLHGLSWGNGGCCLCDVLSL